MALFLGILLLVLALPITILPFLGDLADKEKKWPKNIKPLGKWFLFCMILAVLVGVSEKCVSNREGNEKDKRDSETSQQVRDLPSEIKDATDTLLQELLSLDSITDILTEVNKSTSKSLKERGRVLKEFNAINEKIKISTDYERLKFNAGRPDLVLDKIPYFSVIDSSKSQYLQNFPVINLGGRTASDVDITIIAFYVKNNLIYHSERLEPLSTLETRIPPSDKSGNAILFKYIVTPRNNIKLEVIDESVYLYLSIKYADDITKDKHEFKQYYFWENFKKSKYEFGFCTPRLSNIVKEYIKQHNIKTD